MAVRSQPQPIIIRRVEDAGDHAHHGGAWKVAYADFMTAMMAFFLLMWIVSNASKDQLNGLADYFTPAKVSMTAKGGVGALGGTTMGPKGVMNQSNGVSKPEGMDSGKPSKDAKQAQPLPEATDAPKPAAAPEKAPVVVPDKSTPALKGSDSGSKDQKAGKVVTVTKTVDPHAGDDARFKAVQQEITQAMNAAPDLKPLLKNVMFQKTPEGLQIQIVDQHGKAMFASGSAKVDGATLVLMQQLGKAIAGLPNKIRISGHTDAVPYADGANRDNWELSSERANAVRRVFLASGVAPDRVSRISGLADTDPLNAKDPLDPRNRRISVLLSYGQGGTVPVPPPGTKAVPAGPEAAAKATAVDPAKAPAPATPLPDAQGAAPADAAAQQPPQSAQADAIARNYAAVTIQDLRKARP